MKQPKKPTMRQKQIISGHKLNPRNWMVKEETETHLAVAYKYGATEKRLKKGVDLWKGEKHVQKPGKKPPVKDGQGRD
ncbi:MAG: hypothetical protein NC300_11320 [Bacteroidales bacterium]|nr:hypothetical protein [Clostridium sp.]MCM1204721.1 hypothetical protein [Bacteroidales bacterium]